MMMLSVLVGGCPWLAQSRIDSRDVSYTKKYIADIHLVASNSGSHRGGDNHPCINHCTTFATHQSLYSIQLVLRAV